MVCPNDCVTPTVGVAPGLFASALNFFAASQCVLQDNFTSDCITNKSTYDFIVVGGGTAGLIVARRLSEVLDWNVLVLEAGRQPPVESEIPQFDRTMAKTRYDWDFETIYNTKTAKAFKTRRIPWTRGKMLGGSGSINSMYYVKGVDADYDVWRSAGNPSWTLRNVDRSFRKAESFQNQILKRYTLIQESYGFDGPQVVNRYNHTFRYITNKILKSYEEALGTETVVDLNSKQFSSPGKAGIISATAGNGMRYSTYQSYLLPIRRKRKNLKVVINAYVLRVLIDENLRAYGVEVDIGGKRLTLYSNLEVIVCAGAVNSPQLLMLSGIGPRNHLESKNIPCKVDLPVGQYLQDHTNAIVPIFGDVPGPRTKAEKSFDSILYLYNRTGLYAQTSGCDLVLFFALNSNATQPLFEFQVSIFNAKDISTIKQLADPYVKSVADSLIKPITNKGLYFYTLLFLHPKSRGQILLRSENPYDKPVIDANYYSDNEDLQLSSLGIRTFLKILDTNYFKSINAYLQRINFTECNQYTIRSDEYWQCQIKNTAYSGYHACGSCRMGPDPKTSVVNNYLKVHGVINLRVIDASIMPNITSGNTNAPTYMIAEMGSNMIKEEYGV